MVILDSSGCSERASVSNSGSISRTRSVLRIRRFVVVKINELVARIITAGVIIAVRTPSVESRLGKDNIVGERHHSRTCCLWTEGRRLPAGRPPTLGVELGQKQMREANVPGSFTSSKAGLPH